MVKLVDLGNAPFVAGSPSGVAVEADIVMVAVVDGFEDFCEFLHCQLPLKILHALVASEAVEETAFVASAVALLVASFY